MHLGFYRCVLLSLMMKLSAMKGEISDCYLIFFLNLLLNLLYSNADAKVPCVIFFPFVNSGNEYLVEPGRLK